MFLLVVNAFLRIEDITVHSGNRAETILQLKEVIVFTTRLALAISHFKHITSGRSVTLSKPQSGDAYCPVSVLTQFLMMRGKAKCPLFVFPMFPQYPCIFFGQHLCKALQWAGLDPTTRHTVVESVLLTQQLTGARVIPKYRPWVDGSLSRVGATSVLPCSRLIYPDVIVFGVASGSCIWCCIG